MGQNAVAAEPERDLRSAVEGRLGQIWLTPQGFIKAAVAGNASAKTENIRGVNKTIISFTALNKFKVEGVLNEQNLVEWIQIAFDNAVLGDMTFEAVLSDYKDFSGVKFPTRIVQREGGYPVLDVTITDVKPNAVVAIDVPPNIVAMKPPEPHVIKPVKLADGYAILKLEQRLPASQQDDKEKERNRARMLSARIDQWLDAARKKAKISYGAPLPG